MARLLPALPLVLPLVLDGCAGPGVAPAPPVPVAASAALAEARALARFADPRARGLALRARELAPDWIAPRRFLDDALRVELLAPQALAAHRATLVERPDDGAALYLAGRLEGTRGEARIARAARLDPSSAWAQHGLAWNAFRRAALGTAKRRGRRALALARDPGEGAFMAWALARYLAADGREGEAASLLLERVADPGLAPGDRDWLTGELALLELNARDDALQRRGGLRAAKLIGEADLPPRELERLYTLTRGRPGPGATAVYLALAAREGEGRARLRARRLAERGAAALALELLSEEEEMEGDGSPGGGQGREMGSSVHGGSAGQRRPLLFAAGSVGEAVEEWRRSLPDFALDGDGLPRDPRLARLVRAARACPLDGNPRGPNDPNDPNDPNHLDYPNDPGAVARARELAEALLAAGWFEEARALSGRVPAGDLELALDLEARATAGATALAGVRRLLAEVDSGRAHLEPRLDGGDGLGVPGERGPPRVRRLDDLLAALAPILARSNARLGGEGETDPDALTRALVDSPRQGFGFVGQVVHPGPVLSPEDQRAGLGEAGTPVGGLAAELLRLARFGVFGSAIGYAPDGVLLRPVLLEPRSGVHLGVAWRGTVVWGEGADPPPRSARRGAAIAGAAVHEGYWVDLDVVRGERRRWVRLAQRFWEDGGDGRVERALSAPPLTLESGEGRAGTDLLLGEADRLRLAVMGDRARGSDASLVPPTLDELARVTGQHEEGHLCDRARFLPVGRHLGRVFLFLAAAGFSPGTVTRRLEERAQLTALCVADDPRLPLVDLVQAAQDGGAGPTPHGAAYAKLLEDFLAQLDRDLEARPDAWPELDVEAHLGQQLHRLGPERVREVALALARRRGLMGREAGS